MSADRNIAIKGDATGNVLVTGDNNVVRVIIVQSTRFIEAVTGENPYRGLQTFEERHALLFFGREEITSRLWEDGAELIVDRKPRLLAVLGRSGSGKSSVVRAGLLPALGRRQWPETDVVGAAVFTPGDEPRAALGDAIAKTRHSVERHSVGRSRIVIVADQFETLFTGRAAPEARAEFVRRLVADSSAPDGDVFVILTMRSDFLGALQPYPELERMIAERKHHRIVTAMSRNELEAAIAGPMPKDRPLPQALVDRLVDQAYGREGALPLLQYTLTQLWEGMAKGTPPERYFNDALDGSIATAIANEADLLLAELGDDRRKAIARRAFMHMIELHEQSLVRRPTTVRSLVGPGETTDEVLDVLRHFAERRARLVTLSGRSLDDAQNQASGDVIASVTHEALITCWPTLHTLVTSNPADQKFHRGVADDAEEWDRSGRPKGSLYRPPNLDLLRAFVDRRRSELTAIELSFFESSQRAWKAARLWRVTGAFVAISLALLTAGIGFWVANQQRLLRDEAQRNEAVATARFHQAVARGINSKILESRLSEPIPKLHTAQEQAALAIHSHKLHPNRNAADYLADALASANHFAARIRLDSSIAAVSSNGEYVAIWDWNSRLITVYAIDNLKLSSIWSSEIPLVSAIPASAAASLPTYIAVSSGGRRAAVGVSQGQLLVVEASNLSSRPTQAKVIFDSLTEIEENVSFHTLKFDTSDEYLSGVWLLSDPMQPVALRFSPEPRVLRPPLSQEEKTGAGDTVISMDSRYFAILLRRRENDPDNSHNTLLIYSLPDMTLLKTFISMSPGYGVVSFSPDGNDLIVFDGPAQYSIIQGWLRETPTMTKAKLEATPLELPQQTFFSPDGGTMVVTSTLNPVQQPTVVRASPFAEIITDWRAPNPRRAGRIQNRRDLSANDRDSATEEYSARLRRWEQVGLSASFNIGDITSLGLRRDGYIVTTDAGATLTIWEPMFRYGRTQLTFEGDPQILVVASSEPRVLVAERKNGQYIISSVSSDAGLSESLSELRRMSGAAPPPSSRCAVS